MALADELFAQAWTLAYMNPVKPKQANLRRAVSAAYYALFHLMLAACVRKFGPLKPPTLAPRIARALSHAEMKDVCLPIMRKNLGTVFRKLLPAGPSPELQRLATAFVELQEERHRADHDLTASYTRTDLDEVLEKTQSSFNDWKRIHASDEANIFLAALLFAKRWSK